MCSYLLLQVGKKREFENKPLNCHSKKYISAKQIQKCRIMVFHLNEMKSKQPAKLLSFETQYKIMSTINREERKINSKPKITSVHSSVCYFTKQNNFNLKTLSRKK